MHLVWHDGVVFKLKRNGISDNILNLLFNFSKNKNQRVVLASTSLADVSA